MENLKNKIEDIFQKVIKLYSENQKTSRIIAILIIIIMAVSLFSLQQMRKNSLNSGNFEVTQKSNDTEEKDINKNSAVKNKESTSKKIKAKNESNEDVIPYIVVDIEGKVKNPGVYQLKFGSRINDLIKEAGGLSSDADLSSINRAEVLIDGEKVYIPRKGEDPENIEKQGNRIDGSKLNGTKDSYLVNINSGDLEELQKIPGVGPSMAKKILNYRQAHGSFKSKEELQNVKGIGSKTYEKIKDLVSI